MTFDVSEEEVTSSRGVGTLVGGPTRTFAVPSQLVEHVPDEKLGDALGLSQPSVDSTPHVASHWRPQTCEVKN